MKSILDPSFRYVPSNQTDLRKTFARIRREQRSRDQSKAAAAESATNVLAMRQRQQLPARQP